MVWAKLSQYREHALYTYQYPLFNIEEKEYQYS